MNAEQTRARSVLDDLLECDEGLGGTEIEFINDMNGLRHVDWSPAQIAWLDKIYGRVC